MSNYQSFRRSESNKRGRQGEKNFEEQVMKPRNWNYKLASARENKVGHFDFKVEGLGTIDVKSVKKISRSHFKATEDVIWLEITNDRGLDGWVKAETLDYVAFERENDFVLVGRKLLVNIINEKCDLNNVVSNTEQALYSLYKRGWRRPDGTVSQDSITMIRMSDVTNINSGSVTIYKKIGEEIPIGEQSEKKYQKIELI